MRNIQIATKILFATLGLVALCNGALPVALTCFALASLAHYENGMLACVITPISRQNCPKGRAGIAKLWATGCENVSELQFNADREIIGITMDATQTDPTFKLIEFEKDTAFFNQEKTRVKSNINVTQTIQFIEPVMQSIVKNALEDLNGCCCMHVIVKDNTGRYHYAGVTYDKDTQEWTSEDMQTGDGSGNTGSDPTSDSNEYIESLTTTVGWYAPFWTLGEAGIPT